MTLGRRWFLRCTSQEQTSKQQMQRVVDRNEQRMRQLASLLADREKQLAALQRDTSKLKQQKTAVESWLED